MQTFVRLIMGIATRQYREPLALRRKIQVLPRRVRINLYVGPGTWLLGGERIAFDGIGNSHDPVVSIQSLIEQLLATA